MRYIIQTKNKKGEEDFEKFYAENKNVQIIDSYEPTERLTREVEKVGTALREYKKSGVSWSIMERYLRGCGHSQKTIEALLGDVKGFYRKMGLLD